MVYPFEAEPATIAWFGVRFGPSTFAIFDAFPDEAGRHAHMAGKVAAALMANAGDLLAHPPAIRKAERSGFQVARLAHFKAIGAARRHSTMRLGHSNSASIARVPRQFLDGNFDTVIGPLLTPRTRRVSRTAAWTGAVSRASALALV